MAIIDKPSDYFNTVLYTGNSSTQSITGVEFQPDFTWIKARNQAYNHFLFDAVRGVQKRIKTNSTDAESTVTGLTSFDTDGFGLGSNVDMNGSGVNFESWNWKAGGTASSNTDGSITSSVSANQDAGFSIVSYTGTETNATVGHGLGVAPKVVIVKKTSGTGDWYVYHGAISGMSGGYITLNNTDGFYTNVTTFWNGDHSSTVVDLGSNNNSNGSSDNMIAYCFAEKQGYSKFGSYTGNGNADGTFVYTGFSPAFIMIKCTDLARVWRMWDNKRDAINPNTANLQAQASDAEYDDPAVSIDFLSSGFKVRSTDSSYNGSGNSYIYMAFAEQPLVGDNPATAR